MQIYYKGVDIFPDISVKQCFHDMYAEGHADELLLRLEDYNRLWDTWNPQKGDDITVRSGAATTGKMYVSRIVPEGATIALHASPIPPEAKNRRRRSWEKVRFLQLFQDVAERYGFTLEQYGIDDHSYGYVKQSNITDLAFLQRRCVLEGAAFIIFDGKIVVYDEATIEKGSPVKTLNVPVGTPFEYQNNAAKRYGTEPSQTEPCMVCGKADLTIEY